MRYLRYTLRETAGGGRVIIPVPESYKDCFTLIQSDYYRIAGKVVPIWKIWRKTWFNPTRAAFFWWRLWAYKGRMRPFCTLMHNYYDHKYGMLLAATNVGYGLFPGIRFNSRINGAAFIGNNVNISQFSNFGTNTSRGVVIGDSVYIAPHVCTISDNHIGNNCCIGAGSIVTKDLMAGGTYAGNPAKRIGDNKHPEYIMNPYPIPEIPEDKIEDIVL